MSQSMFVRSVLCCPLLAPHLCWLLLMAGYACSPYDPNNNNNNSSSNCGEIAILSNVWMVVLVVRGSNCQRVPKVA